MTIQLAENGTILLIEGCVAEDAELLLQHLLDHPEAKVEWDQCTSAHTSVVQVLLAAGRVPIGTPKDKFLKEMIAPALGRGRAASSAFPGRQGDAK